MQRPIRPLILMIFLLAFSQLYAQQSTLTQIYRITAVEAEGLYRNAKANPHEGHFRELVDTFYTSSYTRNLPVGHYLYVKAEEEYLDVKLISTHQYFATALNNQRDLSITLLDSLGNFVSDAKLLLDKKEVPFDHETKTYHLNKWKKDGFLKILVAGDTLFYGLNRTLREKLCAQRWKRFRSTKVGHVLTSPLRWGRNTYLYFRRGFSNGNWRIYRHPFKFKPKPIKGYLALSKPKYRPGDTLKVKAYVTRHNGKPWKKPMQVKIYDPQQKVIYDKKVEPDTPGAYTLNWVLGDSLTLDANYRVEIPNPKRRGFDELYHTFRLEDYQLDEISYSLKASQETFHQDDSVQLIVEGTDANGLPIADGEVALVLLSDNIIDYHADEVLIADTLWQHQQLLASGGPTTVVVPDSILPLASLKVQVQASFANANGELQEENTTFTYSRPKAEIRCRLESGMMIAEYLVDGQAAEGEAILKRLGTRQVDTIALPYREEIRPELVAYKLQTAQASTELYLAKAAPKGEVEINAFRQNDSLIVQLDNPHKIPITWTLRSTHRKIDAGHVTSDHFVYNAKDRTSGTLYFQYQYLWGAQTEDREKEILHYKKLLDIDIEQSPKVIPGETVQVKLKVTDHEGKPAKNVNMVAGAINKQFGNAQPYKAPSISYKTGKEPLDLGKFILLPRVDQTRRLNLDSSWYQKLELTEDIFYQMRWENPGLYTNYDSLKQDSFYQTVAQFAPYLIKNGKAQPIYLIYCNRELVYYYDTDDYRRYSFTGKAGYNRITLRGRDFEYTIDSVLLKDGYKLEIAINEELYHQSEDAHLISRRPVKAELNWTEQNLVESSLFLLKKQPRAYHYIWSEKDRIHVFWGGSGRSPVKIGPFPKGTTLHYQVQGGFYTEFDFEPGFTYEVEASRERLYVYDLFSKQKASLPKALKLHHPGELIFTPDDIKREAAKSLRIPFLYSQWSRKPGMGRYTFHYQPENVEQYLLTSVLVLDDSVTTYRYYQANNRQMGQLPPGTYDFYAVRRDSAIFHQSIFIRPDTTLYQNLQSMGFEQDTALYRKLILEAEQKPLRYSPSSNYLKEPRLSKYYQRGRLISGQVTDERGEGLIFANIHLVGTTEVTETDFNGHYEIWVPKGDYQLQVSYIGFTTQTITNAPSYNTIVMDESGNFDEIVVVAYALSGQSAGLSTTAEVTSDAISVRGSRSNAVNYYIDGVRVQGNLMSGSTLDIESHDLNPYRGTNFEALPSSIRSTFRDDAYWVPNLITDQNGEAYYTVTFPDDITSWKTFVLGQDRKLRGGTAFAETQAYKPLMARLNLPRFMVEGDQADIVGKSLNYTGDSVSITTRFLLDDQLLTQNEATIADALIEKAALKASSSLDSLQVTYALQMDQYEDGEQRSIPVFPKGTKETVGQFYLLEGDTAFTITASPDYGAMTIYAQDNVLKVLLEDLDQLQRYPYGCMEQTASRLIGLVLEKKVKEQLGEPFTDDDQIVKAVVRLKKFQNDNGAWGWWSEGEGVNWITIHATKALQMAQEEGFETVSLEKALRYLTSQLENLEPYALLPVLNRLSAAGQKLDYERYLALLDSQQLDFYDQLQLTLLRQQNNLPYQLDSLDKYRQTTLFGGHYWGDRQHWYHLQRNRELTTLLAYRIYKNVGRESECASIRQYFLEGRAQSPICGLRWGWGNTYNTASILSILLPDLLEGQKDRAKLQNELTISGVGEQVINEFPYQAQWSAGQTIQVKKTGAGPLFVTAYQQFQNVDPEPKEEEFVVKTQMLQEGRKVNRLEQGKKAILEVTLEVKNLTEYLMLEVPVPAGCSYGVKSMYSRYPETHREYFRQHTAIFYKVLQPGTYTVEIELEPRFTGTFTLNPARAEQMYFPVFFGRNELKSVKIED